MMQSPVTPTIPLDQDGVNHGYLRLPHSRDDSAWGSVMIPFSVIQNGPGPTALLTGGSHGDEYEGPIALQELATTLQPGDIQGRVILVPALDFPAFLAGARTSPIDGGNMNRAFPGRPDGTITEKIADFFQREMLPLADVVLDIHSGGKSLDFVPFAAAHVLDDKAQQAACVAAMRAFNAPYSVMLREMDNVGMYDTAAESMGKVFVTTELGGGGSATARSIGIARKGLRNLLVHAGILAGEMRIEPTQPIEMPGDDCFVICQNAGLFEPLVDLGASVSEGERLARIWSVDRTGSAPVEITSPRDGLTISRHFPGLVNPGDCAMVIGVKGK